MSLTTVSVSEDYIERYRLLDEVVLLGLDSRYAQHLVHPMAEHHEAYIRLISC